MQYKQGNGLQFIDPRAKPEQSRSTKVHLENTNMLDDTRVR